MNVREKFATQVRPEILNAIREIAQNEGRQVQVIIEEALIDLVEKRKRELPRKHVMQAYQSSREKFDSLYQRLAK